MATRLNSSPVPEPATHAAATDQPAWAPDEGMVFHTILVRQEKTAYVAVEAPANMPPQQVAKALQNRREAVAQATDWWESAPVITIAELRPGVYEPDGDGRPFTVTAEDLAAPPPIQIVKG
jgi:hypothetical protein